MPKYASFTLYVNYFKETDMWTHIYGNSRSCTVTVRPGWWSPGHQTWHLLCQVMSTQGPLISVIFHPPHLHKPRSAYKICHTDSHWLQWGSSAMEGLLQTELKVLRPFRVLAALFCVSSSSTITSGCRAGGGTAVYGCFCLYGRR